ncbi:MAG: CehA/McbA family metallohydrolase [Candidatus Bathyarchaeota archaeon]|nr:CehA/McbA family metallohydrolase [Candidatus Bathyarchaeota archaeon]
MPSKIDLHVHTCYSDDGMSTLREVVDYAEKKGLNGIAITDHDTLNGTDKALKLANKKELVVIPGVEVTTLQGHVLGLNITTSIPKNLGLIETVKKIHEAGGIAIAAHPIVLIKSHIKQRTASASNLDGIEVINSSAFPFFLSTRLSQTLAEQLKLPQTAGTDAHHADEIGTAYTLVKADPDIDEITEAIRKGAVAPFGKPISWKIRVRRGAFSLKRRI